MINENLTICCGEKITISLIFIVYYIMLQATYVLWWLKDFFLGGLEMVELGICHLSWRVSKKKLLIFFSIYTNSI